MSFPSLLMAPVTNRRPCRMEAADPKELTHKPTLARTSLVPRSARPSLDSPHYFGPAGGRSHAPCPDWPQYAAPGGGAKLQPVLSLGEADIRSAAAKVIAPEGPPREWTV
jgi:hypothetical protein